MCSLEINLLRNLSRKGGGAKAKSKQNVVRGEWKKKSNYLDSIWFKSTTELVRQMETLKTARNEAHIFRDYVYHRSNQERKG